MTLSITHAKVDSIPDDPGDALAGKVLPSDWNAVHTVSGTLDASSITGLAAVATSGSASDLGSGALPDDRLANTIAAGGPTGSATVAPIITYDAHGRLTTVTTATITPAVVNVTGLGTNVATALGNTAGGAGGFALFNSTPAGANPTASIGFTAVNGSAITFLRSDGAPPIDQTAAFSFSGLSNTTIAANGALSSGAGPGLKGNGTWITGGSATTTKPYVLIEPTGTTSTGWSTNGTGLGVNAASGFSGVLLDIQLAGVPQLRFVQSSASLQFFDGATATVQGSIRGSDSSGAITIFASTTRAMQIDGDAKIGSGGSYSWSPTGDTRTAPDTRINRGGAAATVQLGATTGSGAAVPQTFQVQGSSGNSAAPALFTIAGSDQSGTTTTGGGFKIRGGNGTTAGGTVEIWTSATTTPAVAATFTAAKQTKLAGNLWLDNALVTGLTPAVSAGLLTKSIILYDNTGAAITLYGS